MIRVLSNNEKVKNFKTAPNDFKFSRIPKKGLMHLFLNIRSILVNGLQKYEIIEFVDFRILEFFK